MQELGAFMDQHELDIGVGKKFSVQDPSEIQSQVKKFKVRLHKNAYRPQKKYCIACLKNSNWCKNVG